MRWLFAMHPAPMYFAHFVGAGALVFALWI
jgi:hypothetical protein